MEVAGKKGTQVFSKDNKIFCELCENGRTSAVGSCRECEEYMCDTCFRHHQKAKSCRNHVLVKLDKLSSTTLKSREEDVEKCKKHDNETIKFYCRAHDAVGCGDCIILEHSACKPEYIKDLVETFKTDEKFKQLLAKEDQMDSMKMEITKRLKKNKNRIDLMKEKALKEIRQFRSEINNHFDKAEAEITAEVEKLTLENTEQHKKLTKDIKSLIRDIEEVKLKLGSKKNPNQEKAYFIEAVTCKPEIEAIEKRFGCMKDKTFLKRYKFVRSDILLTHGQFGQLLKEGDEGMSLIRVVELFFDANGSLGFSITGYDGGDNTTVTSLTSGGPAERSKKLKVGDKILRVNGVSTDGMDHKQVVSLIKSSKDSIILHVTQGPKTSDYVVGARVMRGPDWEWENQDCNGPGTVTGFNESGWARVKWDDGTSYSYRIGQENAFDLIII